MLEIKRRVVVEHEEPSEHNPVGVIGVSTEWLLDDKRITLCLGGNRHFITAKDVTIESIVEEPEHPAGDRCAFLFHSKDGINIDRISFHQSWIQMSMLRRHYSQSFPVENFVRLEESASVIDCLAIEIPDGDKCVTRIPLRDYLEIKKDAQQLAESAGKHPGTPEDGPAVHPS